MQENEKPNFLAPAKYKALKMLNRSLEQDEEPSDDLLEKEAHQPHLQKNDKKGDTLSMSIISEQLSCSDEDVEQSKSPFKSNNV